MEIKRELKISVVVRLVRESKKELTQIKNSVSPVTMASLEKIGDVLEEIGRETELPKEKSAFRLVIASLFLLIPTAKLLRTLWVVVQPVISLFFHGK